MSDADPNCWICGAPGATGEHIFKKSNLKLEFHGVTQQAPLYFHRKGRRSKPFGSFDAKILKSRILCEKCNTCRTQPHDRAWEKLSNFLGTRKPEPGTIVRANCIFPVSTAQEMLNVHLYFVKRFGCEIMVAGAPIDIRAFSNATLDGTSHPHLYMKLGRIVPFPEGKESTGFGSIGVNNYPDGSSVFSWPYFIGCMTVQVLHATNVTLLPQGAWHPRLGADSLVIAKFPRVELLQVWPSAIGAMRRAADDPAPDCRTACRQGYRAICRGRFQTCPASAETAREMFSGSSAHRAGLFAMYARTRSNAFSLRITCS